VLGTGLVLLAVGGTAAGVLLSALARGPERAVAMLVVTAVAFAALTGLRIPLGSPVGLGRQTLATVSQLVPSRWGAAALAAAIGYTPTGAGARPDALWVADIRQVVAAWLSMALLSLAYLLVAAQVLAGRLRRRS
jgi:ABC-type transport system involved in multi-copper enzyme maturation permease subunit